MLTCPMTLCPLKCIKRATFPTLFIQCECKHPQIKAEDQRFDLVDVVSLPLLPSTQKCLTVLTLSDSTVYVLPCNIHVSMCVCCLYASPRALKHYTWVHIDQVPSSQRPGEQTGQCMSPQEMCVCVCDLERGSRTESLHRCVRGMFVCECVWGLAAELALWNSHVMLFLLPSLNISCAEGQCVEYKVTKKGLFVCFSSCRRLVVLWLLRDCHVEAQNQGEARESEREILSFSSQLLLVYLRIFF